MTSAFGARAKAREHRLRRKPHPERELSHVSFDPAVRRGRGEPRLCTARRP